MAGVLDWVHKAQKVQWLEGVKVMGCIIKKD